MPVLYSLLIRCYGFFIRIAALFNEKARLWVRGRRNIFAIMESAMEKELKGEKLRKVAWFHCASLGEFEQGRPLMETFRKEHPAYLIVLTFFSPSGYEYKKSYQGANLIFYLPLDTQRNARRFMDLIHPDIAFFIKYEFWFNYLQQLQVRKVPHYLVSAIFRPGQHFFKWYGTWPRKILNNYSSIFVQNSHSKELLKMIGVERVIVSGDTRFDRVVEVASGKREFPLLDIFSENHPVLVAGSTWPPDEELLIRFVNEYPGLIRLILVPHDVNEGRIEQLALNLGESAARYSGMTQEDSKEKSIIIIDSVGQLSQLYRFGRFAYVGGGFGAGIHNILEAAVYGMPVLFGPSYEKFNEAVELTGLGGAFAVHNYEELAKSLKKLITSPEHLEQSSEICRHFVLQGKGATHKILENINFPPEV